jgi:nucleoside-diphosphate-sugar epimerase
MNILVTGIKSGLGKYIYESLPSAKGLTRENKELIVGTNKGYDLIIHCAFNAQGAGKNQIYDYYKYVDDNILLTKELTKLEHKKFVYISSISVYNEELSAYKYTKLFSESIVGECASEPLILRCSSLLGKTMRANTLMRIIKEKRPKITLTKKSTYNFILHSDVLKFILKAKEEKISGVYDFVASDYIELGEIVKKINPNVSFGNYTFNVPANLPHNVADSYNEFSKDSRTALNEFLEVIK